MFCLHILDERFPFHIPQNTSVAPPTRSEPDSSTQKPFQQEIYHHLSEIQKGILKDLQVLKNKIPEENQIFILSLLNEKIKLKKHILQQIQQMTQIENKTPFSWIDPNIIDPEGNFPLHQAIASRKNKFAIAFLEQGADPLLKDIKERTAFHYISFKDENDACTQAINLCELMFSKTSIRPQNILSMRDVEGKTPIEVIISYTDSSEFVKYLIDKEFPMSSS